MSQNLDKKKKRKVKAKAARKKKPTTREPKVQSEQDFPDLPSPFSMERTLRQLGSAITDREFESEKEMQAFLDDFNQNDTEFSEEASWAVTPEDQAQELIYQVWEADDPEEVVSLVTRALELDPLCVDALMILAEMTAQSKEERISFLELIVKAGQHKLGEEYFEEHRGYFWGMIETRPYMRARFSLAEELREAERLEEAIAHYKAMLELNPNDNQGVRDILIGCYLMVGDLAGARWLLKEYEQDGGAVFNWSRVLERYLAKDTAGALAALETAREQNQFVEDYLTRKKRLPAKLPDYYSLGDKTEAIFCVSVIDLSWRRHRGAVKWLKDQKQA
ncbi:MAG: hypothetical protein JRI54_06055 [Deltaproteobacteria bacterium]|nr:hypothetical protein [Deltaproteobacteria bacterium]